MEFLCRTCLRITVTRCSIFESFKHGKLISESLMELAPVKIRKHDGFPDNICDSCLQKLLFVHDFKLMIMDSDEKLLQGVHNSMAKSENHPIRPPDTSGEIFVKKEIEDIKSEQVEFDPCEGTDQNSAENTMYIDCLSAGIMGEKNSDVQANDLTETMDLDVESSKSNRFQGDLKNEISTTNNSMESGLVSHEKDLDGDTKSVLLEKFGCGLTESHPSSENTNKTHHECNLCEKYFNSLRDLMNHLSKPHILIPADKRTSSNSKSPSSPTKISQIHTKDEIPTNPTKNAINPDVVPHEKDSDNTSLDHSKPKTILESLLSPTEEPTYQEVHKCGVCEKSFDNREKLKDHLVIHKKNKDFVCDVCGKNFQSVRYLSRHCLTHMGPNPYPCPKCGKKFKRQKHVQAHLLVHKEKLYECKLCPSKYKQRSNLVEHVVKKHRDGLREDEKK